MHKSKWIKIFAPIGITFLMIFVVIPPFTRRWYKNHAIKYAPAVPTSNWEKFSSAEGGFSIWFPGTPKETNSFVTNSFGVIEEHVFYVNTDIQDAYIAGYADSEKFDEMVKNLEAEKLLETSQLLVVTKAKGTVLFEQKTTFRNYPAREFEYKAGGKANYSVRAKYVLAGKRLYSITAVFMTGNPHPEDRTSYFNSFQIHNK